MGILKTKQETLSDRLPYFGFESKSEAVWLKDGSATLSLKVVPKDCSQLIDDDLEVLRAGLTPVLNHLPEGSILQALLMRERSTPFRNEAYQRWIKAHRKSNSDEMSISEAREQLFESRGEEIQSKFDQGFIFQTRCYLTLRVLPELDPKPGKVMGALSHLAFWFQGKKTVHKSRNKILEDLASGFEALNTGLSALGFEISHVSHEERMSTIYEWLNPERSKTLPPPKSNPSTSLSDQVALTDLIENQSGIALGRTEVQIASLKSLPEFSIPAVMQQLSCASVPFSMVLTIYVLSQSQERERLLRKQRLAQGMASGNMVRNLMAEAQLRDIEDTLGALISSGEKLFGVSFQINGIKESD